MMDKLPEGTYQQADYINFLVNDVHQRQVKAGWWTDLETGERKHRNIGELLALVHSEVSEALEGYRKGLQDDHLPHRSMFEVELADIVIRVFDLAGSQGCDLGMAYVEKLEYNKHRQDHRLETRKGNEGKKF